MSFFDIRMPSGAPVVVSHAQAGWTAPVAFWQLFNPHPETIPGLAQFLPRFSFVLEDLQHLSNEELKSRALSEFPKLALWLLRDARDMSQLFANLAVWADAFRAALAADNGMAGVVQLVRYITLITNDLQFKTFCAAIQEELPELENATMTIAEQLRREGHAKGHAKGLEQGLETGRVALARTLATLLTLKFGELDEPTHVRITGASPETLELWIEKVLPASTLADVLDASPQG